MVEEYEKSIISGVIYYPLRRILVAKKMTEKKSFESSLEELELIVEKLESGKLPLEESLVLFEGGVKIYKECKASLDKADKKITRLTDSLKEELITD